MIGHCLDAVASAKADGRGVVGILCEYTPREMILAARALPVCLCGGSADTIPSAEEDLPANLCPLIKSTYGYHVQRSNPLLEQADLVVAETTCDGKKKMYELMARTRPMLVLELPQNPEGPGALEAWRGQMAWLRDQLQERLGVRNTDPSLREAIATMNRERSLRRRLAGLMARPHPPLTGLQLLEFKSSISGQEADLAQYERAATALECPSAPPAASDEAVRVLLTGVPLVHGAQRVLQIIESAGAVVVCMENCTGVKPLLEDVDERAADPLAALAEKYLRLPCSVMTPNRRRLEQLAQLARVYRPQCVVELVWQACLTYDVESALVKAFVERELGLPYLRIQTDYSPADSARIAVRVEALLEMVRSRSAGGVAAR
jgi:benzoyl-CoA reductase/2-hydroxyglutaryl-CoA dehydratase subunit BcrC/BadD/HgdB